VSNWSTGRRTPTPAWRRKISKRHPDVVASLWEAPPPPPQASAAAQAAQAEPAPPSTPASSTPPPTAAHRAAQTPAAFVVQESPEVVARDTVRRLRRELDRLDDDPEATSRERASVSTALTSATRLLARLSGALEISQSQILRSPHWQAIQQTIVDALRPWPESLAAAHKALQAFGGREP
jgi:hypothetical protein